jgi:hypothetical protein
MTVKDICICGNGWYARQREVMTNDGKQNISTWNMHGNAPSCFH